jgi:hypothetical protein
LISSPAAKAFSDPVSTIAPTVVSLSKCLMAANKLFIKGVHRAFKAFGLFKVRSPTRPSVPTFSALTYSSVGKEDIVLSTKFVNNYIKKSKKSKDYIISYT